MVTYRYLFEQLQAHYGLSPEAGRAAGIYDAGDFVEADGIVERRHAARIFHMLLVKMFDVKDLENIDGASVLLDLYDCRVCVNHIAQVYLRGIIKERLEHIFDGRAGLDIEELSEAISVLTFICG